MTGKLAVAAAVTVISLSAVLPALAGFRIREADLEFPQEASVYMFQGGKARVDGALEGLTVIVDIKNGDGWLIESESKRFAGGKFAELDEILKKIEGPLDNDSSPGGPADKEAASESAKPPVVVKDLGAGERLQGYETRHFQVLLDGEVLEELWLAPKIQVAGEIDLGAFWTAMGKMLGGGAGLSQGYEESETYLKLRAGGYPLRQVLYFVGEKSTIEVTSITVEDLPPSVFAIPNGFKQIGYAELLFGESD